MQPINKTLAYATAEAFVIIQLTFCMKPALKPDWDYDKLMLIKHNLGPFNADKASKIISRAQVQVERYPDTIEKAYAALPYDMHNLTFLACARIVAAKGFEQDAQLLADLVEKLFIVDDLADALIRIARQDAEMAALCRALI